MEKSFVFNSINRDRRYKAEDFRNYFASFIGNGVFPNPSTQLQVLSNNDMTIRVTNGKGFINGAIYENTDDLILKLDNADGVLNRIDRVILRFDNLKRNITCQIKKGIFASSPVPPILQRDADSYELCIAEIKIGAGAISILQSKIIDTRLDSNLCGIVTQTVKTIDTTTLFNQLEAYINERGQDVDRWVEQSTSEWGKEFTTWFDTIKGVLNEDVAGALANKIIILENKINNLKLVDTSIELTDTNIFNGAKNVKEALIENKKSIIEIQEELGKNKSTLEANINAIREVL